MKELRFIRAVLSSTALFIAGLAQPVFATGPAWWVSRGVLNTNATANDYGAVNQGQVKNIASNACAELDEKLSSADGAGSNVVALVNSFSTTNSYFAVNNGQLKNVAKAFYDRLIAVGYTNALPWTTTTADDNDYAIANIGQAKNLFSWELTTFVTVDSDADGMPDFWERNYFGNLSQTATGDFDGDGVSNLTEFLQGRDPTKGAGGDTTELVNLNVFTPLE